MVASTSLILTVFLGHCWKYIYLWQVGVTGCSVLIGVVYMIKVASNTHYIEKSVPER